VDGAGRGGEGAWGRGRGVGSGRLGIEKGCIYEQSQVLVGPHTPGGGARKARSGSGPEGPVPVGQWAGGPWTPEIPMKSGFYGARGHSPANNETTTK